MKTNEYLYGEGTNIQPISKVVTEERIKFLNNNLSQLLEVNYLERDIERINAVIAAIYFWEKMGDK